MFDWIRQSNEIELTEMEKNQSNQIERSFFEPVIYVKQALKTDIAVSARSVAQVFFQNEDIPQKSLQMRCGMWPSNV